MSDLRERLARMEGQNALILDMVQGASNDVKDIKAEVQQLKEARANSDGRTLAARATTGILAASVAIVLSIVNFLK